MAGGRTIEDLREREADTRGMKDLQLGTEQGLRAIEGLFLERAFPECLAFYRVAGPNPKGSWGNALMTVMLPCLVLADSLFSRTVLGSKMTLRRSSR